MIRLKEGQLLAKSQSYLFALLPNYKRAIYWWVVIIGALFVSTLTDKGGEETFHIFFVQGILYALITLAVVLYATNWGLVMLFHKITNGKKRYELYYFGDKLVCTKYKSQKDSVDIPYFNIDKITFNSSKKFFIHFQKPIFGESVICSSYDLI